MSPRKRHVARVEFEDTRANIARTSVIAVAVSDYQYLHSLPGAGQDITLAEGIFSTDPRVSLFASRVQSLRNPTAAEFRNTILDYTLSRSARGDILILYFSGHGAVLGANAFAFCLRDTAVNMEADRVLPLSVVGFREVVQTLSAADVFPVFVVDACFSGLTAPQGSSFVSAAMQDDLHTCLAGSYALLASSGLEAEAFETVFGGVFTQSLHRVVLAGLSDEVGRHMPFLTLSDVSSPLQHRLALDGYPLSRCYVGPDLPRVAVARNVEFRPDAERLVPYMIAIVACLWNDGQPREVTIQELITCVGIGAYANHSKLSLPPWGLLEDGVNNSTRRLTPRGLLLAQDQLLLPRDILRDPTSWEWVPAPGTDMVRMSDFSLTRSRRVRRLPETAFNGSGDQPEYRGPLTHSSVARLFAKGMRVGDHGPGCAAVVRHLPDHQP